jgi:molybdopterin converting factor small subunit
VFAAANMVAFARDQPAQADLNGVTQINVLDTTISQLVEQHRLPPKQVHRVLVNGTYIAPEQRASKTLAEGDVLAIWPPIAGG